MSTTIDRFTTTAGTAGSGTADAPRATPYYLRPERATFSHTMRNALIVTRREMRDSIRDWRIIAPILILTFVFPSLAQFVANRFSAFVEGYGASLIGDRMIPFLLMIVGFFPISISLVIALETFVGEKERKSLEPLLSTPLTNTELYIGKTLSAMLPPLISSYGGMLVYLSSLVYGDLAWRPPAMLIVQIILLTTVQALVMITGAVVVSSQTTSTRAANLLASFIIIPMTLVIQGESAIMFLAPDADSPSGIGALWAIIVGMSIVVILLLRVGNSIFNREELLGRSIDSLNFKGIVRSLVGAFLAVDARGTRARSFGDWYVHGVLGAVRRLGAAGWVTVALFAGVFAGGYLFGQLSGWQLNLPTGISMGEMAGGVTEVSNFIFGAGGIQYIFFSNARILLAAVLLGMFSFGVFALVLTPAVWFIIGYILSQVLIAGYNPGFFIPAIFTHGVVEIPVIIIATAAALRLGAVVTRPPAGLTVGQGWTMALGDTVKLWIGVIIPGLLLAATIEALITPRVVAAFLGG